MWEGEKNHRSKSTRGKNSIIGDDGIGKQWLNVSSKKYPKDIIKIKSTDSTKNQHPTQKSIALMEYLIKTYTNKNELVLDFTAGSFSTMVACQNTNRKCIGIEMDEEYFNIGLNRVKENQERIENE